ncbi:MAG TPA: type II toxin-antitoxin system prevent-host-death family antitoxin [Conexibacter sp.]|nr:type II toxin-antitoxin system prevent-host-death family antitoxin [Conexibacter sp.]
MRHRTIPQRELRNDIAAILREAEAGTEFTVTVRGRPVAKVGPIEAVPERRRFVDRETLLRIFRESPVDEGWAADLAEMRAEQPPIDDPWNDG